ncbi:permease [Clostridiales bacterium COT073_COT-073]|nr:permease [Clostridiales bacterium COT073_COT-073]
MQQFAIIFLSILLEALPFVLIGTIISSLIEIFISREWLANHLPQKSILAFLIAGLAGIIFPVCECAIVPIMRRLVKKGMPIGVAVTFMLATPTINPVVLLSTHYAFPDNIYFPLLRGGLGYLTALTVGLIMAFLSEKSDLKAVKQKSDYVHNANCGCAHNDHHDHETEEHCTCIHDEHDHIHEDADHECSCGHSHATRKDGIFPILKSILLHTSNELYEVGRFLIFGVLISATMQTFVPREYFLALSKNPALSIVMMMTLAFVLSLCSEADAFIAATFRGNLSNSSIIAFLLFGPMMDIKNMLMLAGGFKARFIIRLIATIGLVVFIFSSISAFLF